MNVVRTENIRKVYPGTIALDKICVTFEGGMVNALVGKNGSGKSTLLKIIAGAETSTDGKIFIDDVEVKPKSPAEAYSMGIATVFQELSIVPGITVAENILIGRLPTTKNGLVDWKETYRKAAEILTELGIDIDPKAMAFLLSASQLQMVEIAKAMSYNPKVLQLDEPTSSLSQKEVNTLFKVLRNLKEKGVVIIYVSHRLQELWDICDTCTIFRDGQCIDKLSMKSASRQDVLSRMFGEIEIPKRAKDIKAGTETLLEVQDLCRAGKFHHINLSLRKGEVLGIAGMLGAGRTELLRSIFGADAYDSGKILVNGHVQNSPTPEKMKKHGVAMLQEDRKRDGIIPQDTIANNLVLSSIQRLGKSIFVNKKIQKEMVDSLVKRYEIKLFTSDAMMSSLSGGNQQKVIVARWMNTRPQILLFDEPSRGIDVASKQQIFRAMWDMARAGISSIMVSSELEELLEVCTRIIVMKDGRFVEELRSEQIETMTVEDLYLKCM